MIRQQLNFTSDLIFDGNLNEDSPKWNNVSEVW